jgi:hypothetical protein
VCWPHIEQYVILGYTRKGGEVAPKDRLKEDVLELRVDGE